jgi:choline dehydrogenase
VEYGDFETALNPYDLSQRAIPGSMMYNITTVGRKIIKLWQGCGVGGSSLVNLMLFMRGTAEDYDRWRILGGPDSTWDWKNMLPYFKKARIEC